MRLLVDLFKQEYFDWEVDGQLERYLGGFEKWPWRHPKARDVHPAIRLAGHVYLHVAYDLPRGIAATLSDAKVDDLQFPPGGRAAGLVETLRRSSSVTPRLPARWLFLRVSPAFENTLQSKEIRELLEEIAWPTKLVKVLWRKQKDALQVMAQWVLALRGAAWIYGELIADADESQRRDLVNRLREAIGNAQDVVLHRHCIFSMKIISTPLLDLAPAILAGLLAPALPAATGVGLVLLGVGFWLWRLQRQRREILAAIDDLGRETFRALASFPPGERPRPSEPQPQLEMT